MTTTPASFGIKSSHHDSWKKHSGKLVLALGVMTLLLLFLFQQEEKDHPGLLLGERYLIRVERVDFGQEFSFFQDNLFERTMAKIKDWYDAILSRYSSTHTLAPYGSNNNKCRIPSPALCFWISVYDNEKKSYIDWSRVVGSYVDSSGFSDSLHFSYHKEEKNGKVVKAYMLSIFNPTAPDYYLKVLSPDGNHGILHATNPHAARISDLPAGWSSKAQHLPAIQTVDGIEVTLTGISHSGYASFKGQFLIKKDGQDASANYGIASWLVDIWGNNSRQLDVWGYPLIHSPYWKMECVLFEYGTAPYPEPRLCRLGKQPYPLPQTITPLTASWGNGKESLQVLALLGTGRHYFAGNRWLRAEPIPKQFHRSQESGPFHDPEWNPLDQRDLDENGNDAYVRFHDARIPTLLLNTKLSTPVAVVGTDHKWERFVAKPGVTLRQGYRVFSSDESHWVDTSGQLIPLDWPEGVSHQEITLGIAQRREFEFYIAPAEISFTHDEE